MKMRTTPQERMALGVVALLLTAGVGARMLRSGPPSAEVSADAQSARADAGAASLRAAVEDSVEREEARRRPLAAGERIDPNTASADELDRLPKVGPALAARIVAHRARTGPFRTLGDLDAVSGVGPSLLETVAPHVTLPAGAASASRTLAEHPNHLQSAPPASAGGPIDINAASAGELAALPGIGPALARRIVDNRLQHGRFRSVEELERVPGIGARMVERLRPLVSARSP